MKVELSFHDSPDRQYVKDVVCVVHGQAAVTLHDNKGVIWTYPWCNLHRVKELNNE